jgi:predicted transglutaminase-like protease
MIVSIHASLVPTHSLFVARLFMFVCICVSVFLCVCVSLSVCVQVRAHRRGNGPSYHVSQRIDSAAGININRTYAYHHIDHRAPPPEIDTTIHIHMRNG